jgi:hypothetical protein
MFIPDPDFYPSRIPDLGSKTVTKGRSEKKIVVIPFLVTTKFTKFKNILELFTQKIVPTLSKIWSWDPGSGIQGSKRHRIRIRKTLGNPYTEG